ncbi:DUF3306 domain-containing protein [Mongoliimonas terrestris]|uniref:DUF3306 domain-containing protein n=1 Tax=Mongoliimonas terrestris TaxID=1709001 RepID=UPI00094958FF|nr:DUF3306 domain-containing protein [Mongoliimonas terrestris]
MSRDQESFLARWSLRKQASRQAADDLEPDAEAPPGPAEPDRVASPSPDDACPSDPDPDAAPDSPTLTPIDELGQTSDYRPFLKSEVPKAVRLAALRKAWTTDPAIAAYRPLADYDWDFNAPGYAALRPTDDPSKFIKALFRHLTEPADASTPGAVPDGAAPDGTVPDDPAGAPPPVAEPPDAAPDDAIVADASTAVPPEAVPDPAVALQTDRSS